MATGECLAGLYATACRGLRHAHLIDNAETPIVGGPGLAYQLLSLSPRNFHIQQLEVAVRAVSFDLNKAVAGRAQSVCDVKPFARHERDQLVTKSQMLFDGYSKKSSTREAYAISQRIHRMIHIEKNLGDGGDVNDGFEKAQDRGKYAPALDDGDSADCIQRHVGNSCKHNQAERDEDCRVHWWLDSVASEARRIFWILPCYVDESIVPGPKRKGNRCENSTGLRPRSRKQDYRTESPVDRILLHLRISLMSLHRDKRESGEKTPTVQARRMNLFASDFLEQPGARKIPVIIDGGQRNPQNLRYLRIAHPSEIAQFDQFGLNGIFEAEGVKHFVHGQQLVIRAWSSQFKFLNFHAHEAPPVTLSLFAPSTIYQDVAHRLGRSRKKMRAISERRILGSDQPQPGLMYQGSRLKRLAGSLLCHLRRCQMPQFIVNQFKQLGGGLGIALLHRS